jgi:hypothetical protein
MEVDKATGYLQANKGSPYHEIGFTPEKKKIFLKLAADYVKTHRAYPPIDDIADQLGINIRTFYVHTRQDPAFKHDWEEIKSRLYQIYTKKLEKKIDSKSGVVPNIVMLKYLEKGQFSESLNPVSQDSPSKELINSFSDAIDAEIVQEPKQIEQPIVDQGTIPAPINPLNGK